MSKKQRPPKGGLGTSGAKHCVYCYAGLLQSTILESVGCIWFNRSEAKDREIVAKKYVLVERTYIVCYNIL